MSTNGYYYEGLEFPGSEGDLKSILYNDSFPLGMYCILS